LGSVLIVGGSVFLGRAVAAEALRRGHVVTTLNRGISDADLPGVQVIRADRESHDQLAEAIRGKSWTTVVDTCGGVPHAVADSTRLLTGHAGHYIYISSVNAIRDWPAEAVDEESPTWPCAADADESAGTYGVLRAGCERAVQANFRGHVTIVRPGIIVGPRENIGRLPWWLRRMHRGGPTLVPREDSALQVVDARDLAAFLVDRHEQPRAESYITVGQEKTSLGEMIAACAASVGGDRDLRAASDEFLLARGVQPWWELPLWAPRPTEWGSACAVSGDRAVRDGLACRPLAQTIGDTWSWLREAPGFEGRPKIGMNPAREREILAGLDGGGQAGDGR
jgi:2'-hydroxyisoflavone reductase